MADPVPVCDLLCEGAEYLSKLGSNLRVRVDNLKTKRIRKDKLKNTHAVQKAINKVLLICKLSKKSIENVETSFKNILEQISVNQADQYDENTSKPVRENDKYHYFTFESRKIKIRKKVKLSHYFSATVTCNQMTIEIQNKYPVYYNCKLFRQRKINKKLCGVLSKNSESSSDCEHVTKQSKNRSRSSSVENDITDSQSTSEPIVETNLEHCNSRSHSPSVESNPVYTSKEIVKEGCSIIEIDSSINDSGVIESETTNKDDEKCNEKLPCNNDLNLNLQINKTQVPEDLQINKTQVPEKQDLEINKKDLFPKKTRNKNNKENSTKKRKCNSEDKKKYKHIVVMEDSSDSNHDELLTEQCTQNKQMDSSKIDLVDSSNLNCDSKHCDFEQTITKNSSYEENECGQPKTSLKDNNSVSQKSDSENFKCDNNISEKHSNKYENESTVNNDVSMNDDRDVEEDEELVNIDNENSKAKNDSNVKPLIKCVNINTLLKKDMQVQTNSSLIEIVDSDGSDKSVDKYKGISKTKPKIIKNKPKHKEKQTKQSINEDDQYWIQKREEVKMFKSKEFVINVTRFPKTITNNFLATYNLSRILLNGDVICEVSEKVSEKVNSPKRIKSDVSLAKNELLIDSDTDSSNNTMIDKIEETLKSLLNDSDSEVEKESEKNAINSPGQNTNDGDCYIPDNIVCEKSLSHHCSHISTSLQDNENSINKLQSCDSVTNCLKDSNSEAQQKDKDATMESSLSTLKTQSPTVDKDECPSTIINKNIDSSKNVNSTCTVLEKNNGQDNVNKSKVNILEDDVNKPYNVAPDNILQLLTTETEHKNTIDNTKVNTEIVDDLAVEKVYGNDNTQLSSQIHRGSHEDNTVPSDSQNISENAESAVVHTDSTLEGVNEIVQCGGTSDNETGEINDCENAPNEANFDSNNCNMEPIETDSIKKILLQNSDSDKGLQDNKLETEKLNLTNPTEEVDTVHETKLSLLQDSSDEQRSRSKPKSKSDSISPLKQKHMESIHAKKMLLTYSSSSDTDDEQLKSVLKDIRDSLLNDGEQKANKKQSNKSGSESTKTYKRKLTKKYKSRKRKAKVSSQSGDSKSSDQSTNEDNCQKDEDEISDSSIKKMSRSSNVQDSSYHNSDTQDDKDIAGLTNLNTLAKKRKRRSSSSSNSQKNTRSSARKKMPKVPLITNESFLKAESSSEAQSASDCEDVVEELPSVTVKGLNGDGIAHLAKNDLLEESESSSSHNEKDKHSSDIKQEDSSEEDNSVKTKRRKGKTISSDSEVGSSRKKKKDIRLSDFEDSEDENSEPIKRSKRKKKNSDSDASVGSSVDGSKKKRKRIKHIDDSEVSGSESENEGRNKHGRKNIRKVMGKNQLEEATKKAAREEKERIARITERQKLYNNLEFDESGKPDEVVLEKVVLDFDPDTKEPLIELDPGLVKKLKPHQANGIKFMWNACFESVKRIKKDKGSGCILAHCMGLGKTLQVVSLTHTLLTHSELTKVNRVLVVCPLSTVLNWVNEFKMWLKHTQSDFEVDVYELSRFKQNSERAYQLSQWFQGGGVCVLGYEMFRNLSADNSKKFKKKMLRNFQESLVDPGPDLVVCDEGHLLKNEKTSLSQAMNRIKSQRRIVLTGTPLQNNLKEYYCMVQFVKPNLLGKYNEYLNRFVNPITNGQYTDSTEHDIRVMKRRSHVLHKMLDGSVQRRDYGVLAPFLPPKHEYVLFITLSEIQIKLYQHYLDNYSRKPLPGKSSGFLFPDFQSLQRIWTHPLVLKYNSERYEIMQQKKREREEEESEGSLVDFINDSSPEESSSAESTDESSDVSDDSRKKSKKKKSTKKGKGGDSKANTRRGTRANPIELEAEEEPAPVEPEVNPTEWWIRLVADDELEDLRHSHKLVLLFDILRQCEAIGDKLLVFSQSLYSLDLIEHFLGKIDDATQDGRVDEKLNGHVGSWSQGIDYFRLDGSTSCENRSIWCKNFNKEDNPRARLFLISTRAGGLGINLVAANRVVIFDVSWNPSHDVQSIFRVYRFGQKKPCYVYRFLAMGTMEEKIYERQVTKQAISKRVIDEQQIDRHYAENDLAELYKFEPAPPSPREIPPLPKDRLFAEMLKEHEAQIYKYHEHDSLLENKEEETLTEEERKAAWEDFENEKTRPPPTPFTGAYMHNGMMPGLIQQQQMAYAALGAMLRKDMPNINDNQIRDMLPLIYNANPGLLQKMNDIYKYAQPGMMNPGMMNPAMNPGGGMGMGGSSGLQYEPPWQRQQQQMRLQQLMQQQNQMGAKYYAGGLGSRDPVAMALQQQRAREMMLGERGERGGGGAAGPGERGERPRPRGRPPARAPAPMAAPDVVDLDSDW